MKIGKVEIKKFRFVGCILGGAAGDALGMPLEGLSRNQIKNTFGFVDKYVLHPRKRHNLGQWTDDTALTKAILSGIVEKKTIDIEDIASKMRQAYLSEKWRGFGITTRKVLEGQSPPRKSSGAGAAMRIAPVALYLHQNLTNLREKVIEVSKITHNNPAAIDGALAVAFSIAKAASGKLRPENLIRDTQDFLGTNSEVSYKLKEVGDLLPYPTEEGLDYLGTRGNILEVVASSFYAFLKSPDNFYESITKAINAGGDTDTIGSITGAISGTYNGVKMIPKKWLNNLEARTELEELSIHLFKLTIDQRVS